MTVNKNCVNCLNQANNLKKHNSGFKVKFYPEFHFPLWENH